LRTGYLAALASRTLGVAPVLKPPTPSRFEPENPQAQWREVAEVQEAAPGRSAAPGRARPRADEAGADPVLAADRPLRGFFGPDLGQGPAARVDQDNWAARDGRATPEDRPAPSVSQPAGDPAEPARGGLRAAAAVGSAVPGEVAPGHAAADAAPDVTAPEVPWAETSGHASSLRGSRAAWLEDVVQPLSSARQAPAAGWTDPSRQQARAAEQAGGPPGAPGAGPAIVVRIGRVDVRAVRAAPPAAQPPPPRPPAGPSLAEHLRARDRGRR
jgi:hypothetical protein